MKKLKIVIVDSNYLGGEAFFARERKAVEAFGGELHFADYKTDDEIAANAADADVLLCCGNPPITRKVLQAYRGKLVVRYGIGVNSVDLAAATENGKIIYNSPGFCQEELVMHASALILAGLRNIGYYNQEVKKGNWPKGKGPAPRRLSGLTIGLFGFGDSARPMATVFRSGFGSRVIAYDPYMDAAAAQQHGVEAVDFETLLREADVLSIHAPLTEDTRHIFNMAAFRKMKKDALLINVSRGGLVCEKDLAQALQEGEIGFAGLDVLETEPVQAGNPLLPLPNTVITPHSGFYGREALDNNHVIVSSLIGNYANGILVKRNVANKDILPKLEGYTVLESL